MKYIFILGNNPELSKAEIAAVLPSAKFLAFDNGYAVIDTPKFDCTQIMSRLGGTIKIAVVLGEHPDFGPILGAATAIESGKRFNFGVSFYGQKPSNIGMQFKGKLKEKGIAARLVSSREPALSSVIVTKEKCSDFIILPDYFGLTCAVQDFKDYGKRDFGRPASDATSGMLPPKAAKMMINLAQISTNKIILDPFCGSGTILSEALALGFTNLIGSDLSAKAVADTEENLHWLAQEFEISDYDAKIYQADASKLSADIMPATIDAIITEPYLGKPMRGNESTATVRAIIADLEKLYAASLAEFAKLLKPGGRVVIVIPEWHMHSQIYRLNLAGRCGGLKRLDEGNLIYKREGQKVWRNIWILSK